MEKEAFGNLILENEVQLYRIAKSILKRDEDCADAAQEAIARAFEKLHTLKRDEYAKTWLIRILIHECYRLAARRKKELALPENWPDYWEAEEKENYSSLYEALQKLDTEFRVVLVLHYLEGFSVEETAGILKIPKGTVKSRLHRGREKMKSMLLEEEM